MYVLVKLKVPFESISELPKVIKKYSKTVQRQYLYVWNSVYKKVLKETKNKKIAESRASRGAASVLKKRFRAKQSMENNSHEDFFSFLTDIFMDNLKG